jgi:prepilin-type N-terminal cleavage/methylation domain-containing protein
MTGAAARLRVARSDAGFSLIEVVVSMIVLALILAYLPSNVRFVRDTWDSTGRLDRQLGQEGAKDFITARLAEAMPLYDVSAAAPRLLFAGEPNALSFIAPSQNGPIGAGLYRFDLATRPAGTGVSLVAVMQPFGAPEGQGEEHTLVEEAASAAFRYLGRVERLGKANWKDRWPGADTLPDAVELTLTSKRRGEPPVRRLVVQLRLRPQG